MDVDGSDVEETENVPRRERREEPSQEDYGDPGRGLTQG
jgi:hypothetical protein